MEGIREKAIKILYDRNFEFCHDVENACYWATKEYRSLEPTSFMMDVAKEEIENKPTYEVYQKYRNYCWCHDIFPISQCAFSRRLQNYFGIMIIDKRLKEYGGKKCRVFKVV